MTTGEECPYVDLYDITAYAVVREDCEACYQKNCSGQVAVYIPSSVRAIQKVDQRDPFTAIAESELFQYSEFYYNYLYNFKASYEGLDKCTDNVILKTPDNAPDMHHIMVVYDLDLEDSDESQYIRFTNPDPSTKGAKCGSMPCTQVKNLLITEYGYGFQEE